MREDVYDFARLAGAFRAFQRALPTTSLRIHRRRRLHRASGAARQRSVALARSVYSAPMGTTSPARRVLLGEGWSYSTTRNVYILPICAEEPPAAPEPGGRNPYSPGPRLAGVTR